MARGRGGGLLSLTTLLAAGFAIWATQGTVAAPQDSPSEASFAETQSAVCADCHGELSEAATFSPHSVLDRATEWLGEAERGSCIECHGDPEAHLAEGGGLDNILAFDDADSPAARTASCQTCHGDAHPRFEATGHAAAGLSCDSCHSIHGPSETLDLLRVADQSDRSRRERFGPATAACAECHGDVLTQFEFNERHRLQEGVLGCASCHDPHQPSSRLALGGFKQEGCVECHTDKAGPFVFEHGSQKVEGCVACHSPHGSPNRHLLAFQRVAESCYSCHGAIPGFHARFTLDTVCTNCHSTIHGSNLDADFLK